MKCTVLESRGIPYTLGLVLLMSSWVIAKSATWVKDHAFGKDDASVVSLRREMRQAPSFGLLGETRDLFLAANKNINNQLKKKPILNRSGHANEGGFYKTFGSDADGTKGYVKEAFGKGDHGYKTLDTFHKQDGDNYGFEEHSSFGHDSRNKKGRLENKKEDLKKEVKDHEGSGTIVESYYADGDDGGYYSEGGGGSYEGGSGGAESGSYDGSDGYSESYSSGEGDGGAEGGYSEGESDDGYYEGDY